MSEGQSLGHGRKGHVECARAARQGRAAHLGSPPPVRSGHVQGTVPGTCPKRTGGALVRLALMRILLWHGYLLGGTGSNVYTRALAREWSRAGHEVVVFSQDRHPVEYDLGGARHVRPEIGPILPVFVLDRYEGVEARLLPELTHEERERFVEANADALRAELPADLVFANHVLLGGPVASATGAPYAVKAHGSELEYAIRGNADLAAWARES